MPALRGLPVAIVDVETTGLDPAVDHVVEIAVAHLALGGGPPVPAWRTLVRPPVPIPAEVIRLHGITDEAVADAPTFSDVLANLGGALDGRVLAAYNAPFDFRFLSAEIGRAGAEGLLTWPWLDPSVWVRVVDQFQRGKRLADACARRGIGYPAHGAAADATAAGLLVGRLLGDMATLTRGQESGLRAARRTVALPATMWKGLDALLAWQTGAALALEHEAAEYAARLGQEPRACPWHELAGLPVPSAPARQEPRWVVDAQGNVTKPTEEA
jgi:DNA polymerase III epsilon subunit-like protein